MDEKEPVGRDVIGQDAIVDAAIDTIVRNGLAGLTLRPLASSLGVSVGAISARMGTKDQLIDRVVDLAARRDQHFFDRWIDFAARVGPVDSAARAAVADLAFRDWMTAGRRQAIFLIELVHHHALLQASSRALDQWLTSAGAFWSTLMFGTTALADLALGYVLDEAGFALGAGDDPVYAVLRVLCLQRFVDGLLARGDAGGTDIERLIALLEPDALPSPSPSPSPSPDDPKRQRIADSVARIIVSQGMNAATHRAVALVAGVPASTVVYHFGGRAALVVAGLHAVIARFHGMRDRTRAEGTMPVDDADTRDLVKATSMIALASAREPSLRPYAIDMRRRRGENIRAADLASFGFGPGNADGFDRATAQVLSIALFGMRMTAMARMLPERACYRGAFAALDAWNAGRVT
ncbi:TetR family transcriptional regulator [Sphingomonas sp. PB2P12]|uniref:TetR family transcriptional regulator n=1 Tax=Sphingomonas sandaracina TaxID=3096157 RepID=UPI002FC88C35